MERQGLTLEQYGDRAMQTAIYPLKGRNMVYPAIKLAGEAGELADKIGKHWRNNATDVFARACEDRQQPLIFYPKDQPVNEQVSEDQAAIIAMASRSMTNEQKFACALELGDVLWYVNAIATELGYTLEDIGILNLEKLNDRRQRLTLVGEGDNR